MPTPQQRTAKSVIRQICRFDWPGIGATARPAPKASGSTSGADVLVDFGPALPYCIEVEVKGGRSGKSQIRPLDYLTLIVEHKKAWYVLGADEVMFLAAGYAGQHSSNPFAAFNPGTPAEYWEAFRCDPKDVPGAVVYKHFNAQFSAMQELAQRVRRESERLAKLHRLEVLAQWRRRR